MGYDNRGIVYQDNNKIKREIFDQYIPVTKEILEIVEKNNFFGNMIVKTKIDAEKKGLFLEHEKHFITYPHEWSPNMFKDACVFYIDLLMALEKENLCLKDALPSNILFNSTSPVFIDFLSIINKNSLSNEKWLVGDLDNLESKDLEKIVLKNMFFEYMFLPLLFMSENRCLEAKNILTDYMCNNINDSSVDVSNLKTSSIFGALLEIIKAKLKNKKERNIYFSLKKVKNLIYSTLPYMESLQKIREVIVELDVDLDKSAYADYYEEKKENYDLADMEKWGNKQKNIYKIMLSENPQKVLDIGANTGWFSCLAESLGSKVISVDIDSSCIDMLYRYSKEKKLKITPLVMSFDDFNKEIYGKNYEDNNDLRNQEHNPVCLKAIERFRVDMLICLGLLHHLVLGEGKTFEDVLECLSKMSEAMIIEFVNFEDKLILENPEFFASIGCFDESNYNINIFETALKSIFEHVELLESTPETRKLFFCKNKKERE